MVHYCEQCVKEFTTKATFVRHLKTMKHKKAIDNNGITNKIHNCEQCVKEFPTKRSLTIHFESDIHKRTIEYDDIINTKNNK